MQPTLPGVEEAATPSAHSLDLPLEDRAPSAALPAAPPEPKPAPPTPAKPVARAREVSLL